ncbi:hypothetical protein [Streptomyces griseoloalbus]|uniref:Uncharacterized protein n=1 Tax=Streptomyces griseoloalbus TaxID=67303 RepID=A0A7W8F7F2_9ACTN|nr:hypothetical protein [Streptomyces albaduncus]MBB5124129.1 hypothetical protein [Streptomyces albaduncus]GGW32791.1 hypothetical protein GCM10010340_08100 [Streptomyces albaduncus]
MLDRITADDAVLAGSSPDWNDVTATEQLREDQCLMSDVLRLGGPAMTAVAREGLNQPPDKLRELANRAYWEDTPLATAYTKDRDAASQELDALNSRRDAWAVPLDGLETPGGFTVTGFHWPPGSPGDDEGDFYSQTGLTQWVADRFWKSEDDFYEDPTPLADEQTVKAVTDLGAPLYGEKPYDPSPPADERQRQYNEERAFERLTDWSLEPHAGVLEPVQELRVEDATVDLGPFRHAERDAQPQPRRARGSGWTTSPPS